MDYKSAAIGAGVGVVATFITGAIINHVRTPDKPKSNKGKDKPEDNQDNE